MLKKIIKGFYQNKLDDLQSEISEQENLLDVMIPYADLMTLLLIFFVMFFIYSSLTDITAPSENSQRVMMAVAQVDSVSGNEIVIQISSEILFASGKAELKTKSLHSLMKVAADIQDEIDSDWQIRVEGHTDNVPISTEKYASNWELSTARAISVVRFFLQNNLFIADQLQAMGYGEFKPLVENSSAENRKKNRRVEIRLIKNLQTK